MLLSRRPTTQPGSRPTTTTDRAGLDLVTAGWLASMFSATGMLIALVVGVIADRLDHWRLVVSGLAVTAASAIGTTPRPVLLSARI